MKNCIKELLREAVNQEYTNIDLTPYKNFSFSYQNKKFVVFSIKEEKSLGQVIRIIFIPENTKLADEYINCVNPFIFLNISSKYATNVTYYIPKSQVKMNLGKSFAPLAPLINDIKSKIS
jgi:hypothetical protein